MTSNVSYLDLDAIVPEVDLTVKLDGKDHRLEPISVEDFIANLQLMEKMGTTGSVEEETKILVDMLARAFPTIGGERLFKLSITQLNALMSFAKKYNGQDEITGEVKSELEKQGAENPPQPTS